MPLILVWEADVWPVGDDAGPTSIQNKRRCLIHTENIHYAGERTTGAGEPYLVVLMADAGNANVVDQTLESLAALSRPTVEVAVAAPASFAVTFAWPAALTLAHAETP
jgi:hypothetical protein